MSNEEKHNVTHVLLVHGTPLHAPLLTPVRIENLVHDDRPPPPPSTLTADDLKDKIMNTSSEIFRSLVKTNSSAVITI